MKLSTYRRNLRADIERYQDYLRKERDRSKRRREIKKITMNAEEKAKFNRENRERMRRYRLQRRLQEEGWIE